MVVNSKLLLFLFALQWPTRQKFTLRTRNTHYF